jgi:hypothetical protein
MTATPTPAGRRAWSEDEVRALGVSTDLVTAGAILGIGRTTAHALARDGRFPVPLLRVGRRYRVPVAPILHLLALPSESGGAAEAAAEEALDRADASSRGDSQRT